VDAPLLSLLIDTVTIAPWASQDAAGQATYGSPVNYAALVEYATAKVDTIGTLDGRGGSAVLFRATVHLNGRPAIGLRDKLTLPSGETPKIIAVLSYSDQSGGYTTEVHC
jgi:hypothetical protein